MQKHEEEKRRAWSSMPHARRHMDLPKHDNGRHRIPRLTDSFEAERCVLNARQLRDQEKSEHQRRKELEAFKQKRRGSKMVKRDRPRPVLKPSPSLAHGPDAQAHYDDLALERRDAQRANRLAKAKSAKEVLQDHNAFLNKAETQRQQLSAKAHSDNPREASKEAFKLLRRVQSEGSRAFKQARSISQDVRSR